MEGTAIESSGKITPVILWPPGSHTSAGGWVSAQISTQTGILVVVQFIAPSAKLRRRELAIAPARAVITPVLNRPIRNGP